MENKKELGFKLHNKPDLEEQVVKWINKDKKISDYKICQLLKDKYKYKISSPSINSWRKNYFTKIEKQIQDKAKTFKDERVYLEQFDFRHKCLNDLREDLKKLVVRKNKVEKVLDSKIKKDKDGKEIYFVDTFIEKLYTDYVNMIIGTREKLIKYSDEINPFNIVREILERILKEIISIMFEFKAPETAYKKLKDYFTDLETEFYEKYSIKNKR